MKQNGKGTLFDGNFVEQYNNEQMEMRKNLPNLFDAMVAAQCGDDRELNLFFFYKMKLTTYHIEGSPAVNERRTLTFMDKQLNTYLHKMIKKYTEVAGVKQQDTYGGMRYEVSTSTVKFEAEEIYSMFATYISDFHKQNDLTRFYGVSEEHTMNNLRKYIKIDFDNNVLKAEYNKRMEVERVQVNGEQYMLKNKMETAYFDDIVTHNAHDENGNALSFLDTFGVNNIDNEDDNSGYSDIGEFILDNYKEIFTKNQLEKFSQLVEWCNTEGNSVEELFQRNNPTKLSKSKISRILYPDKKTTSTMKNIDDLFKSMNKRMDKALGIEQEENDQSEVRSTFLPLPKGTKAENALFKKYQMNKYVFGLERTTLSDSPMYKSVQIHTPRPFILMEHYEMLLNSEISAFELYEMYEKQFEPLNHVNGEVITSLPVNSESDYDWLIDEPQAQKRLIQHVNGIIERIQNGSIQFTHTINNKFMKPNTTHLKLIPTEDVEVLKSYSPMKSSDIICNYYNKETYNAQPIKMMIVERYYAGSKQKKTFISQSELTRIRLDENEK